MLCEDNSGATTNDAERLLGLTLGGDIFTFAKNNIVLTSAINSKVGPDDYRQSEWAGACYSPDGAVAVREHPDAGRDIRHHRSLGIWSAISQGTTNRAGPPGFSREGQASSRALLQSKNTVCVPIYESMFRDVGHTP